MTQDQADPDPESDLDARRLTITQRLAGGGALIGLALGIGAGALGAEPQTGMAIVLLISALASSLASLYALTTLLYDELKQRHPSGRRALWGGGLFVLAAMLMAMVAGIGG